MSVVKRKRNGINNGTEEKRKETNGIKGIDRRMGIGKTEGKRREICRRWDDNLKYKRGREGRGGKKEEWRNEKEKKNGK